jgi:hypothetical protein
MNDRAAVKSPENPGFKPKNSAGADLQRRELWWSSCEHAMPWKLLRFDQKHRETDEKRRKLRDPNLTAATYGVNLPRLLG